MTYKYPNAVLMIFCKAPIPGQVKTRLIPKLTAEQAAELHIELSIKTLQRATQNNLCPVQPGAHRQPTMLFLPHRRQPIR